MRLINTGTLALREFYGNPGAGMPHYAILSHTWGADEVSYYELTEGVSPERQKGQSYLKIKKFLSTARQLGYNWAWVDTCCIDKSSSAELSEAINSMFNWYANSHICLAYLSDVNSSDALTDKDNTLMFRSSSGSYSRWFTRGWTLQELLAPQFVYFYDSQWKYFGDKKLLQHSIATVSKIRPGVLADITGNWGKYSIAEKFSWASHRNTTRVEDEAYSLIGLFDVNMPLLYGEGNKAFLRLQQEIIRQNNDQSILVWQKDHDVNLRSGLFAPSARQYTSWPVVEEKAGVQATTKSVATSQRYGQTQDMFLKLFPSYVSHFQVTGHTLSIDQPLLGPVKSIFVSRTSSMFARNAEIPSVTGLKWGSSDVLDAKPNSNTTTLPDPKPYHWSGWQELNDMDVYIMPLLCSLDQDSLCMLLYRPKFSSSLEPFRRLHTPSVFSLDPALISLLTRPSERQYAYSRSDNISFTRRVTKRSDEGSSNPSGKGYGFPVFKNYGSNLEGYSILGLHVRSDGTIAKSGSFLHGDAKQMWSYEYTFDKDQYTPKKGLRFDAKLRRGAGSDTCTANFSIALYGDTISIAIFKVGNEPTMDHLLGLESIPPSVFEPNINPFIELPGLIKTIELDVWTFELYEMTILDLWTLSLRSTVQPDDGGRNITVAMLRPRFFT